MTSLSETQQGTRHPFQSNDQIEIYKDKNTTTMNSIMTDSIMTDTINGVLEIPENLSIKQCPELYQAPVERCTLRECTNKGVLENMHPHKRDSRLDFAELGHHYFIDGIRHDELHYLSSTTFLGKFFKPFDGPLIVRMIMRGKRWMNDPTYRYYRMEESDILGQWKQLGDDACRLGSYFHISAEYDCNLIPVLDDPTPAYQQYLAFRADNPHLVPYRTEMLIFDEKYRIVGSVDGIFKNLKTNKFLIIDWKRSKEIKRKGGDKGLFPIEHLRSNNLTKYSLQLSLYTFILEMNYGWDMEASALVVCHPNQDTCQYITAKYMKDEIQELLDYRLLGLYKNDIIDMPEDIKNADIDWDSISL